MTKFYAGIGSRATPPSVLLTFARIAKRLEALGYTLRSGGAAGADTGFEMGVQNPKNKEIYLPWKGFNNSQSELFVISEGATIMASQFHPRWSALKPAGRKFMARNCYQVLGYNLIEPVDFIVCWTPNGQVTGGTGQALRMAAEFNIPVINFGQEDLLRSPMDELRKLVVGEGI